MAQKQPQAQDDADPSSLDGSDTSEERPEEKSEAPRGDAQQKEDARDRRVPDERGNDDSRLKEPDIHERGTDSQWGDDPDLHGREPTGDTDVLADIRNVSVDEIHLNVEGVEVRLALRARAVNNLLQVDAGVFAQVSKVELDIKGVQVQALLEVKLENLYDILDRVMTTIDRNPEVVEAALKAVDSAVDEVGDTASSALGPGGAATEAVDQVGGAAQEAVKPGGAVSEAGQSVGQAVDDTAEAVGDTAQAAGDTAQAAGETAEAVGDTAGNAGASAGEEAGTGADQGASTLKDARRLLREPDEPSRQGDDDEGQQRDADRRGGRAPTKRRSKRQTRSRSSNNTSKSD